MDNSYAGDLVRGKETSLTQVLCRWLIKESGSCPNLQRIMFDKGRVGKNGGENNGESSGVEGIL